MKQIAQSMTPTATRNSTYEYIGIFRVFNVLTRGGMPVVAESEIAIMIL